MYDFAYQRPSTVDEAVAAFAASGDARFLAGGQSLLPMMKHRLVRVSDIVDLAGIPGMAGIRTDRDRVVIRAGTLHADVAEHQGLRGAIPALAALVAGIGDRQVRNRGTLGGALAHNDPAGDYPAAALALEATIHTDRRTIAADDFFTGMFETALAEGELITAVEFPAPEAAAYLKFANPASRYAVVGVMIARRDGRVRVAVTGAGPCVFRPLQLEAALERAFTPQTVAAVSFDHRRFNGDIHATPQYRVHLITVLAQRAVATMA